MAASQLHVLASELEILVSEYIEYCCITVDEDDTVCVLSRHDVGYVLSVYTEDGAVKNDHQLQMLDNVVTSLSLKTKESTFVVKLIMKGSQYIYVKSVRVLIQSLHSYLLV